MIDPEIQKYIQGQLDIARQDELYSTKNNSSHTHNGIDSPTLPFQILSGKTIPTLISAPQGTLYVNTLAKTATTRVFVNTTGGASWASFTASA